MPQAQQKKKNSFRLLWHAATLGSSRRDGDGDDKEDDVYLPPTMPQTCAMLICTYLYIALHTHWLILSSQSFLGLLLLFPFEGAETEVQRV